jgi:hypothetical protein
VCNKNKVSKLAAVSKLAKPDLTGRLPLKPWQVFMYISLFAEKLVTTAISIFLPTRDQWMP